MKCHGAKPHPNSGAGRIKYDGSSDHAVIEVKHAAKSFAVSRKYVAGLHTNATRQGKDAVLVLVFPDYEVTMHVTRRHQG